MSKLAIEYTKLIEEEAEKGEKEVKIKNTGRKNPKRHLEMKIDEILNDNIGSILGRMIATKAF
jgi:26S proteasome regulatory subunit N11